MKKRLLALILTVILAISLFPITASADKEPNDSKATAESVALNDTLTGTISASKNPSGLMTADDTDWYKYELPAKGTFTLILMPRSTSSVLLYDRWVFQLFNEEGQAIANAIKIDILGGAERTMGPFVLEKGNYYLRITGEKDFDTNTTIGQKVYRVQNTYKCHHEGHQTDTQLNTPTCSERGKIEYRCDDCGEVSRTEFIDKLPHTLGDWEVTKEPTCAVTGVKVKICSVCGETAETEYLPKLEHETTGEWVVTRETSCAQAGERVQRCTVCGGVAKKEEIEAPPHTPDGKWVVTEATCKQAGQRTQKCTVCGGVAKEETIKQLDHTFSDWRTVKLATCTRVGEEERSCSVCGEMQKRAVYGEHDFDDWTVTTTATCAHKGIEARKCRVCGKREMQDVPMVPHTFGDWKVYKAASCNIAGFETRECKVCRTSDNREIPAKTHDFSSGLRIYVGNTLQAKCSICGNRISDREYYEWLERKQNEVTVTRANSTTPTVIVLVVPAFTDVNSSSWYQSVVTYAYNLGLMVGNSDTTFNPMGNVTVAEAVTMAARARNSYNGGTNNDFKASSVWYQTYVDYALENGIIKKGDFDNYTRVATRAEMAYIFAHALPEDGMKAINKVTSLPDVTASTKYSKEIFTLYNAGILTGSDTKGTFLPDNPITRSEAAAIITRITLSSERKTLSLK